MWPMFAIDSNLKETLAKQFNLPANGASLISHVVIFTLNNQYAGTIIINYSEHVKMLGLNLFEFSIRRARAQT
ncbi:hypothetical protein CFP56_040290 [Quercus suber]|uniref:Uncharacterized protein n=1 Tax=Quercus suber TaxID=58331 RepID=A0AAW0LME8_QUESU